MAENDNTEYVMLKDSWGHDGRFVKGYVFKRSDVPENYQFDAGLRKGTFAPVDNPDMVDLETGVRGSTVDADGNMTMNPIPGQLTEQVVRTDGNDNKTEADVQHAAGTDVTSTDEAVDKPKRKRDE